jgi:hypothetical protein
MPAACADCNRPLRHSTDRQAAPGTVCYAGNGVCVTCRSRRARIADRPTDCHDCGRTLHYRGGPRTVDSVTHVARGLCRSCYDEERQLAKMAANGNAYPNVSAEAHAHTVAGYTAWLTERRKRGVPADGYQVADEPDTLTQLTRGKTPSQRRAIGRLLEQLETERDAIARATRTQEARHRYQYGIVA